VGVLTDFDGMAAFVPNLESSRCVGVGEVLPSNSAAR